MAIGHHGQSQEAVVMFRSAIALLAVISLGGATHAYAQESAPGPGTVEVTLVPGGATFFTNTGNGSSFGNYNVGAGVAYNFNRIVGIEGEFGSSIGISQNLTDGAFRGTQKTPNTLTYSGNLVVSAPTGTSVVPYVTGGVGALTMLQKESLGVGETTTFLTGNVGGGVKWYAPNNRWGLRGDYRFLATRSKDTAPAFFGQDTRYGHRVYGAVIINAF
jgi:Outer membrane protein beta-barrel domain